MQSTCTRRLPDSATGTLPGYAWYHQARMFSTLAIDTFVHALMRISQFYKYKKYQIDRGTSIAHFSWQEVKCKNLCRLVPHSDQANTVVTSQAYWAQCHLMRAAYEAALIDTKTLKNHSILRLDYPNLLQTRCCWISKIIFQSKASICDSSVLHACGRLLRIRRRESPHTTWHRGCMMSFWLVSMLRMRKPSPCAHVFQSSRLTRWSMHSWGFEHLLSNLLNWSWSSVRSDCAFAIAR